MRSTGTIILLFFLAVSATVVFATTTTNQACATTTDDAVAYSNLRQKVMADKSKAKSKAKAGDSTEYYWHQEVVNTYTAATTCTSDEYEASALSTFADRVCSACAVCTSDEYESTACSGTVNRVCTACTTCTSDEYESTACAGSTNRVCTALTVCASNEQETTAATATSDRICEAAKGHITRSGDGGKAGGTHAAVCMDDSSTHVTDGGQYGYTDIGVRCCSDATSTNTGGNNNGYPKELSEPDGYVAGSSANCLYAKTYTEAETACTSNGYVLCSLSQVDAYACAQTGCGHDQRAIWTRDECTIV